MNTLDSMTYTISSSHHILSNMGTNREIEYPLIWYYVYLLFWVRFKGYDVMTGLTFFVFPRIMVIFTFSASKFHSFCLRFMIQCELTPDSVFWSSMVISSCLQILVSGDTVSLPSWELTYPHIPSKGSWEDEFLASHLVGYVIVPWRVCFL